MGSISFPFLLISTFLNSKLGRRIFNNLSICSLHFPQTETSLSIKEACDIFGQVQGCKTEENAHQAGKYITLSSHFPKEKSVHIVKFELLPFKLETKMCYIIIIIRFFNEIMPLIIKYLTLVWKPTVRENGYES